jgi:signal peptidase I
VSPTAPTANASDLPKPGVHALVTLSLPGNASYNNFMVSGLREIWMLKCPVPRGAVLCVNVAPREAGSSAGGSAAKPPRCGVLEGIPRRARFVLKTLYPDPVGSRIMRILNWKGFRWIRRASSARQGASASRSGFILLWLAVGCTLSFYFTSHFIYSGMRVVGASMYPTLVDGDRRVVNRWWHRAFAIERGDLALLHEPGGRDKVVKRVIGLPGETVELRSEGVYINGHRLPEHYLRGRVQTLPGRHGGERLHLKDNQYFVLGDNRQYSIDSRCYGPVTLAEVLGIVIP